MTTNENPSRTGTIGLLAGVWLFPLLLLGCQSVETSVNKNVEPYDIQRVAVLRGEQSDVDDLAYNRFISQLMKHGFDVLERRKIRDVMAEGQFDSRGEMNESSALEVARLADADALLFIAGRSPGETDQAEVATSIRMTGTKNGRVIATSNLLPGEEAEPEIVINQMVERMHGNGWLSWKEDEGGLF